MVNRRSSANNSSGSNESSEIINNEAYEESSTTSSSSSNTTTTTSQCVEASENKKEKAATTPETQPHERLSADCSKDVVAIAVVTGASQEVAVAAVHEKLICSLPLERLSGILGSLAQSKRDNSSSSGSSNSIEPPNNKILCLYCDRTFSIEKLYKKHAERVHKLVEGRRTSIRNNNVANNADAELSGFPGCSFCPANNKQAIMVAEDLDSLFSHLLENHKDKYFACKQCVIRFPNEDSLATHMKLVHNIDTPRKLPLTKPLSVVVDFEEEILARAAASRKDDVEMRLTRSSKSNHDRRNDLSAKEQMLIRLGMVE